MWPSLLEPVRAAVLIRRRVVPVNCLRRFQVAAEGSTDLRDSRRRTDAARRVSPIAFLGSHGGRQCVNGNSKALQLSLNNLSVQGRPW
jgi:hypothetical protein